MVALSLLSLSRPRVYVYLTKCDRNFMNYCNSTIKMYNDPIIIDNFNPDRSFTANNRANRRAGGVEIVPEIS